MDTYALGQKPVLFEIEMLDYANPHNPVPITLAGASRLAVKFWKPDGTVLEKPAEPSEPGNLAQSPLRYLDSEGILDQRGLWQYAGLLERSGTVIETVQRFLFRVR